MPSIADNPALGTYAVCTAILAIKLMLTSLYTAVKRRGTQSYANAEDAAAFGDSGTTASAADSPEVALALRIQRNDGENIPAFFAVALVYILTGGSAFGATVYLWTFTIARLLHTVAYANQLQPWRALTFFAGLLCIIGMSVSTILHVL